MMPNPISNAIAVDSSALVALLRNEPDAIEIREKIKAARIIIISTITRVELTMVIVGNRDESAQAAIDDLLREIGVFMVPFDGEQAHIAEIAFTRYGKGRHKAALNFGDCMTYALAKALGVPLLFKGTDFAATDIVVA